ncbi:MAG: hypothetical protein GWP91_11410 [Rhodobacterales bacterium]|nr:hypothetical protein [Rhodobacterales bacterium]
MRIVSPLILALLTGCGSEQLTTLEVEQADLRKEYDDLEGNVVALRNQMVELGLMTQAQANAKAEKATKGKGKGKGKGKMGNSNPKHDLSDVLNFTAERTGTPPQLPPLTDLVRTETPCGYTVKIEDLQPISDFPLNRDGLGKSSPVVMFEDGEAMASHAGPEAFEEACAGAYRHAGFLFLFSPSQTQEIGERVFSISLAEDIPYARGEDQRPMYWVYPGTTLNITLDQPWDETWGEMKLDLSGRVLDQLEAQATLTAGSFSQDISGGAFQISEEITADGPLTISITSPENGPYLVLSLLTIGNPGNALVVTSQSTHSKGQRG